MNILLIITSISKLKFMLPVIKRLAVRDNRNVIVLYTSDDIRDAFDSLLIPDVQRKSIYEKEIFKKTAPDLIICFELWVEPVQALLELAHGENIPILLYDHASLLFQNLYVLEKNEFNTSYRADNSLAYKIACWGDHGKKCWAGYGVPEEKFIVTGAPHFDELYAMSVDKRAVCEQLMISRDKKIVVLFSCLGHPSLRGPYGISFHDCEKHTLEILQEFVKEHSDYELIVKPHPSSMLTTETKKYYRASTVVSDILEKGWDDTIKVDIAHLVAVADVVVASTSSAVILPLILNVPLIHVEVNETSSRDFSIFAQGALKSVKKEELVNVMKDYVGDLSWADLCHRKSEVASLLNYKNDGCATERFIALVDDVLRDRALNNICYSSREKEYEETVHHYPNLPYNYQHLIKFLSQGRNYNKAVKWFLRYSEKFSCARRLFEEIKQRAVKNDTGDSEKIAFYSAFYSAGILNIEEQYALAILCRLKGLFAEASQLLTELSKKELSLDEKLRIKYELGLVLHEEEKYEDSLKIFNSLLSSCPEHHGIMPRLLFRIGEGYYKREAFEKAEYFLQKCILVNSSHKEARRLLETIVVFQNDISIERGQ